MFGVYDATTLINISTVENSELGGMALAVSSGYSKEELAEVREKCLKDIENKQKCQEYYNHGVTWEELKEGVKALLNEDSNMDITQDILGNALSEINTFIRKCCDDLKMTVDIMNKIKAGETNAN